MKRVVVEHLSKKYDLISLEGIKSNFRELLLSQITSFFHASAQKKEFYALEDVSFDVEEGEIFGIIGKNGSGKSTLLKIISRITAPSFGKVTIKGKVASLLEVGTGFHGELSGRENIYLSGIILGMKRHEINMRFEQIVAFAGLEKFLSVPVKKYSSGMRLRLAFSIAAHLYPEILLIDEVLAVGDYEFEKKCIESMDELGKAGRTIILVSHNTAVVQKLCSRVLVLQNGREQFLGDPSTAISVYLGTYKSTSSFIEWNNEGLILRDVFRMRALRVLGEQGKVKEHFFLDEAVVVEVEGAILHASKKVMIALYFYDDTRTMLFSSKQVVKAPDDSFATQLFRCIIPSSLFSEGIIKVTLELYDVGDEKQIVSKSWEEITLFSEDELLSFTMHEKLQEVFGTTNFYFNTKGKLNPSLEWVIAKKSLQC